MSTKEAPGGGEEAVGGGVSRRREEAFGQHTRTATTNTNAIQACLCRSEPGESEGWSRSTTEAPGGGEEAVGEGGVQKRRGSIRTTY